MNITQKSFLIVAFTVIFAGGCVLNKRPAAEPKQKEVGGSPTSTTQEVVTTSTEASINTSGWKTYRNADVGLELIVPVDSSETKKLFANDVSDVYHHPFWYSLFDVYYFTSKNSDIMFVSVTTTSTIDFFADRFTLNLQEDVLLNGYRGKAEVSSEFVPTFTEDVPGNYTMMDRLILKNGEKIYFIEAHFYAEDKSEVKRLHEAWRSYLSSIKFF